MRPGIRQINVELEKDDWLRDVEYGEGMQLDHDDAAEVSEEIPIPLAAINPSLEALRLLHRPRIDHNGYHLDFFNFSNDHLYERLQPRKVTLRQTGAIELKHAGPANKLQMPFVSQAFSPAFTFAHALLCLTTVQAGSLPRRSSALAQAKSPVPHRYTVTLREVGVDRSN